MKQNEKNIAIQEQEDIIRDRMARLGRSDYVEHKIVDAICLWAKGDKPTASGLVSSILSLIGKDAQYSGFPESKEALRGEINAAQDAVIELQITEPEEDVNDDAR